MARTPLTEREKQLLEEGKRNTALRAQGQPVPEPAPSVSDPNREAPLTGPVEKIGTATRVGDRLYGSATGVTPDTVDKAKSYLSTQSALDSAITNPKSSLSDLTKATKANDEAMGAVAQLNPAREMIEIAPGVKADYDTAKRTTENIRYQDASDRGLVPTTNPTRPDYAKANAAINRMVDTKRDRENPDGVAFKAGRDKWNETLVARENEKNLNDLVQQDMQLASRENASARRNYYALERAQRDGKIIDPDAMKAAQDRLGRSDMGQGPTNNVDDRRKRFRTMREKGETPNSQGMGLQGQPIGDNSLQSMIDQRNNPYGSPKKRRPLVGSIA